MANVVTVFLVRQTLHSSATWFGIEGAVSAAAMTVGSLLAGRRSGLRPLTVLGLVGMTGLALSCLGYSAAPSVIWLMVPAAACGLANAAVNVSLGTVTMMRTPEHARGRVAAAISGVTSSAMIGSMLLGGALAAVLSPREIFAGAGAMTLLVPALLSRTLLGAVAQSPTAGEVESRPARAG
jgi:MFS family permease